MAKFTKTTTRLMLIGAIALGSGVYYEKQSSQAVDQASQSLIRLDSAQMQTESAIRSAQKYARLLESMRDQQIDHQEPYSIVSEFSSGEVNQLGSLLGSLYQRDGHFFLQRFHLSWQEADPGRNLLPRVALELEGRKVLLFSGQDEATQSLAAN